METTNSFTRAIGPVISLIVAAFLYYVGLVVAQPFVPDILLHGLCPGKNECSEVIFFVGALQLGAGVGAVVIAPILGDMSDKYGRKPVLLLIFLSSILPPVVLVFSTTKTALYVWFVIALITYTIRNAGIVPMLLASVADVVDVSHRSTAVGWIMGSLSGGFLTGTCVALLLKTVDQALWTAVIVQVFTTVYLMIAVKETNPRKPLLPADESPSASAMKLLPKLEMKTQTTNLRETAWTVWNSRRLMIIAVLDFLNNYAYAGLEAFTVYYLRAAFDYGKNEIATLYLVGGGTASLGQSCVYPVLAHFLGERGVLSIGLVAATAKYFFYGLAWAPWVPYLAAGIDFFSTIIRPALGTMVSVAVDGDQQGSVQGFMGAVRSGAVVLAPFTLTPLTAAALGDNPPFNLMGLPFIIFGLSMAVAWVISIGLPPLPPKELSVEPTEYIQAPSPPEDNTSSRPQAGTH